MKNVAFGLRGSEVFPVQLSSVPMTGGYARQDRTGLFKRCRAGGAGEQRTLGYVGEGADPSGRALSTIASFTQNRIRLPSSSAKLAHVATRI